jgi:hypothetical protein
VNQSNSKLPKHLLVIFIIFSNFSFGKEFNELFTIYEPIKESSQIEKSINSSFNNMVYRLSGSSSPSNVWKIINSGVKRKDFILSYSIKKIDDQSYLQVVFDQKKFINQMVALSIPIVNYSRPVLFFLIEVDSGSKRPYFLTDNTELSEIDKVIIESLNKFSSNRGIFLELPVFDLQDTKDLSSLTILSNPVNRISSKYNFDQLIKIKLTKSGINNWYASGDLEYSTSSENSTDEILAVFDKYLIGLIDSNLSELNIKPAKKSSLDIFINDVYSYEDYINSRDRLNKTIGISSFDIMSFQNNTIAYKANTIGNIDNLINEFEDSNYFKILNLDINKKLILLKHQR